ncbi:MAG: helix-turn-helix domain-containing protein, partial [Clostridia bacterium]|nr:helix-turn-helix domain-containing protein [Clostridia bacterium]
METKDIIFEFRTRKGLSQDELAEKVFVTRQAVSRWENGETIPNTETLKLLSELFDVSINTLLGSPRQLVCECCGMPIDDSNISHEKDGALNENYCGWCYADGEYTLAFFVNSGNIDSMVAHYTAAKKHRSDDAYTPGGKAGVRPDRAVIVYS